MITASPGPTITMSFVICGQAAIALPIFSQNTRSHLGLPLSWASCLP
jgi:hypothetical protein